MLRLQVYRESDYIGSVVSQALSGTILSFLYGIIFIFYFTVSYYILQCCN